MRRRFFVDEVRNGHAHIEGDHARHLTSVLRVEAGQRYEISDNRNVFLAEIESARKNDVVFRTLEKLAPEAARVSITLFASLVKFDHFEWIIEKATELGVARIVPVIAIRTERGLEKAAEKRIERWRRIALEASQQSRRAYLPELEDAIPFGEAVKRQAGYRYVLDEEGGAPLAGALPSTRDVEDTVAVLIGPEGGWTEAERQQFGSAGWARVSMGPLILRAETAAIAAISVISGGWL
ncbi:MAG: RsmE family RNA methyltransferase [Acidobacteriota bacterium]